MNATSNAIIFVSVKFGSHLIFNKVGTIVKEGESLNCVGKELRKEVSDHPKIHNIVGGNISPKRLSWAIFDSVDDETPILNSENWL